MIGPESDKDDNFSHVAVFLYVFHAILAFVIKVENEILFSALICNKFRLIAFLQKFKISNGLKP